MYNSCKYCGSDNVEMIKLENILPMLYYCECQHCMATGASVFTEAEAVMMWNRVNGE